MLQKIFALDSGVIRGLLVAFIGLAGACASLFGVQQALFDAKALPIVDALNALLAAGGLFYAAYARATKPNPPLTETAVAKTVARLEDEKSPPVAPSQGGFARVAVLSFLAIGALVAVCVAIPGCVGTRAAYQAASSPDEVAFVVAEQYAASVKEAADIAQRSGTPAPAITAMQLADRKARPLVEQLKPLRDAYLATKSAGDGAALQSALTKAAQAVADLIRAVKTAKAGA